MVTYISAYACIPHSGNAQTVQRHMTMDERIWSWGDKGTASIKSGIRDGRDIPVKKLMKAKFWTQAKYHLERAALQTDLSAAPGIIHTVSSTASSRTHMVPVHIVYC